MTPDCRDIRKNILWVSKVSGHGHIPTSFSIVEPLYAIYASMRHHPADTAWEDRDIFILSKGHGALAYYCVLSHFGYFPLEMLRTFGQFMSGYGCHADRFKVPGVEVSTGSLGHGIGVAVGIALAFKLKRSPRRVYTLIGDGESNEGSVWEAIMVANNLGLTNLTVVFDNNGSQIRSLPIGNPAERFRAFGCQTLTVDGHNLEELNQALAQPITGLKVIVANTIKGYGCRTLVENMFEWHRKSPGDDQYERLLRELDA